MATAKKREQSPLNCIPSSGIVRQRLELVLKEAQQLRVLLRTAVEIEKANSEKDEDSQSEGGPKC